MDSKSVVKEPGRAPKEGSFREYSQSGLSGRHSLDRHIPMERERSATDLLTRGLRRNSQEFHQQKVEPLNRSHGGNHMLFYDMPASNHDRVSILSNPSAVWMNRGSYFGSVVRGDISNIFIQRPLEAEGQFDDIPDVKQNKRNFSSTIESKPVRQAQLDKPAREHVGKEQNVVKQQHFSHSEEEHPQQSPSNKQQKKSKKPTKNLLRDFAKNFHEYVLHNHRFNDHMKALFQKRKPKEYPGLSLEEVKELFRKDVQSLRDGHMMQTFHGYQQKWEGGSTFDFYYRYLTMKFYLEESPCYFLKSKVRLKYVYLDYLRYFIRGLQNPSRFDRFSDS